MSPLKAVRELFKFIILPVLLSTALFSGGLLRQNIDGFKLTVAHFNDSHASIEESGVTLNFSGTPVLCKAGGYARLVSRALELRTASPHFLLLNAGDVFQGTPFFMKYSGMSDLKLMNMMKVDAMVPGNHEFDRSSRVLADFIEGADFPVISSNIDYSNDRRLRNRTLPWKIFSIDGVKVGVMGLTLTETREISSPSKKLVFTNVADSAAKTVGLLEMKGAKIIIALTHLGLRRDIGLAHNVRGIDLIVGGHSHSIMGDFGKTGPDARSPYPLVIKNENGEKVLIVQAWARSKMMGDITLTFDAAGRVRDYDGAAVLLLGNGFTIKNPDGTVSPVNEKLRHRIADKISSTDSMAIVEPDREAEKLITRLAAPIKELETRIIGSAEKDLWHTGIPGSRHPAAGLLPHGSLIAHRAADSMVWKTKSSGTADSPIAVVNAGGIRTDINRGDISEGMICTLMPFGNRLITMELNGRQLRDALSQAIRRALTGGEAGAFPYVSGMRYSYTGGDDPVIKTMEVPDGKSWKPLEDGTVYTVVTNSYLAGGGDGYKVFRDGGKNILDTGFTDNLVFIDYIRHLKLLKAPEDFNVRQLP